jgi:hypothetical protein
VRTARRRGQSFCQDRLRQRAGFSDLQISDLRFQIQDSKFKIQDSKIQDSKTKCAPGVPEGRRAAHSIGSFEQFFS